MPCAKPIYPAVHIVGVKGRMGQMLGQRLAAAGYPVSGSDADDRLDAAVLASASIALLCVPPAALSAVAAEIGPKLGPEQLLMDITSVKTLPLAWMEAAHGGPVIGSHPLFGPSPRAEDLRVALVAGTWADAKARSLAERLYTDLGCEFFWTTAQEHDRQLGLAQSLNFTVNAAFFDLLAEQGLRPEFMTPSCRRLLNAARKILTEDAPMFLDFTRLNPEFPALLAAYRERLNPPTPGDDSDFARVARRAAACYLDLP